MTRKEFITTMNNALDTFNEDCKTSGCGTCTLLLNTYPGSGIFTEYAEFLVDTFGKNISYSSINKFMYDKYEHELSPIEATNIRLIRIVLMATFFADCLKNKTYRRFKYVQ